ncbi:MAG: ABC transporter ATP-binding protein [Candidatus Sumerlaeia bacterium]
MSKPILQTIDIHKSYHDGEQELKVLRGIDCTISKGEVVAIVGSSGSGKSTLLNLMGALDKPTSGEILMDGKKLTEMNSTRLNHMRRDKIGFVFQFHHLLPELRAWENIAAPGRIAGRPKAEIQKQAYELLERVGLSDRANHIPAKLSGGEQQRVALARALMNDPALILADEPTGNLDAEMGKQVIDLLWEMVKKRNCSLIIVTHEKGIADTADRILRLDRGKIKKL